MEVDLRPVVANSDHVFAEAVAPGVALEREKKWERGEVARVHWRSEREGLEKCVESVLRSRGGAER